MTVENEQQAAIITPEPGAQGEPAAAKAEGEAQGHEEGGDGHRSKGNGFQRRIDRQTRKYYEEKARADVLEREVERLRGGGQGGQKPAAESAAVVDPDAKPKADDFQSPADHAEAVARWAVRQERKADSQRTQAHQSTSRAQELDDAFAEREDAHREVSETYDDAVDNLRDARVRFAPGTIEFVQDIDKGPALLEYLGTNLKEAKRIAALSPARQIAELTRIEDKLPAAKPKKSGAPDPANPVRARASVEMNPDKLSDAEWYRRFKASKKKS
jgi:hypothetical protein